MTHLTRPQTAVRDLGQAVARLVDSGSEVVVGTCPDLGSVKPIREPLRTVARRLSRQLAAADDCGRGSGGRSVSLGSLLGPEFSEFPEEMFAHQFHPSSRGYAMAAQAILPSVLDSLGLLPPDERVPDERLGDALLPVSIAAVSAADAGGTEVAAVVSRVRNAAHGVVGRNCATGSQASAQAEKPAPLTADMPDEEY